MIFFVEMKASPQFFLLVLASFLSCSAGNAQVVVGSTQGPGGNFYEIVFLPSSADAVKWTKAEALAEVRTSVVGAASAHLATITTPEENVVIEKLRHQVLVAAGLDPHAGNAPPFWVGGFQPNGQTSPSSNWQWVDGDGLIDGVAKYTNWRLGEPNDWPSTGVENNEENHLVIGLGGRFIWADMTGNRQGYVVEYEMEAVSEPENGGSGPSGNYYKVVLSGYDMLWEEAARDAWKYDRFLRGKQPHLATIDSAEEGKYIETLRQGTDSGWENGLWLGGYQRPGQESSEHGWRWVHDEGAIGGTVEGVGYSN